ncbi:MAG: leucyl aminopeptidase family protein [Candidatus Woesearchaeota archaeon]
MITKELETKAEVLALTIFKIDELKENKELLKQVKEAKKREAFKEDFASIFQTNITNSVYKKIIVAHLGKKEEFTTEKARKIMSKIVQTVQNQKYNSLTTNLLDIELENKEDFARAIAESIELTNYSFDKYKKPKIKPVKVYLKADKKLNKEFLIGQKIANATNLTRNLVNDTNSQINPDTLEKIALKIAKDKKLKAKVIKGKELQKKGLNLIHSVGKGSEFEPRLVIIEKPGKNPINIVGKGVTYDTGGYNIKPTGAMEDMKMDMGGAGVVLGLLSISEMFKERGIIFTLPLVENSISSTAYKPGEIIKSYSGKTIEVLNTDAEGRLILADAISYSEEKYKSQKTITIATLTGAILIALGHKYTGLFSNNDEFANNLLEASKKSHDLAWRLPLEEFENDMDGDISDLKNLSSIKSRIAGSIQAAIFLSKFTKNDWAHFDIAGTSYVQSPEYFGKKYATGRNLRLLAYYLIN